MQLKALAAIVSVALTLGVQAVPNPLDHAAGVKGVLKRSYSHGRDMSQVSKRAIALVAQKRNSNNQRRAGKQCKPKSKTIPTTPTPQQPETTPTTPTPQQPETSPPTPQEPETSPPTAETTPDTVEPASSPAPAPTDGSSNNNGKGNNGVTSLDAIAQQWLDAHNNARAAHGAAPLTWSSKLADYATEYANRCSWPHSLGPYGENLAARTDSLTAAASVDMWMEEVGDYDPSHPMYSHFTQVVWKSTTELGCALVVCPNGIFNRDTQITLLEGGGLAVNGVCEYNPPGNVVGQFGENVQK